VKGRDWDLENLTRETTSEGDCGWTMASGLSRREPFQTLRADGYSGEEGGMYLIVGCAWRKDSRAVNWVVSAMMW
jgi:hypothetical protein